MIRVDLESCHHEESMDNSNSRLACLPHTACLRLRSCPLIDRQTYSAPDKKAQAPIDTHIEGALLGSWHEIVMVLQLVTRNMTFPLQLLHCPQIRRDHNQMAEGHPQAQT